MGLIQLSRYPRARRGAESLQRMPGKWGIAHADYGARAVRRPEREGHWIVTVGAVLVRASRAPYRYAPQGSFERPSAKAQTRAPGSFSGGRSQIRRPESRRRPPCPSLLDRCAARRSGVTVDRDGGTGSQSVPECRCHRRGGDAGGSPAGAGADHRLPHPSVRSDTAAGRPLHRRRIEPGTGPARALSKAGRATGNRRGYRGRSQPLDRGQPLGAGSRAKRSR